MWGGRGSVRVEKAEQTSRADALEDYTMLVLGTAWIVGKGEEGSVSFGGRDEYVNYLA